MLKQVSAVWEFITCDEREAELLIDQCNGSRVRFYAYSKHNTDCSNPHWHIAFLFYRPMPLSRINRFIDFGQSHPQPIKGPWVNYFNYLRSKGEVVTNYQIKT